MPSLKELVQKGPYFAPGHRACRGCVAVPLTARHILRATDKPVVVALATGCMEVTSTIYPETAWEVPYIHNTFENAPATLSGVIAAYEALKRKGKINKDIKFVAFGGDGGSYDIGLQSLSGAWERGHDFLYVCYDNEAYMNTGVQRSSATPVGANTTTTPVGKLLAGKKDFRKNLTKIAIAHELPYVAQAVIGHWEDFYVKAKKGFDIKGPTFINVLAPCTLGWKYPPHLGVEVTRKAVETCFWPLFEVEKGKYKLNYEPKKKLPITEFIKVQKRYKHLFKEENKSVLKALQDRVDRDWAEIKKLSRE